MLPAPEDEGFDDAGAVLVGGLGEERVDGGEGAGDVGGVVRGGGDEVDGEGEVAEGVVEEGDPPYRDGAEGVAVVGVGEGDEAGALGKCPGTAVPGR